jgi:hypothetical protein
MSAAKQKKYRVVVICQTCETIAHLEFEKSKRPAKGTTMPGHCGNCNAQKQFTVYSESVLIRPRQSYFQTGSNSRMVCINGNVGNVNWSEFFSDDDDDDK